MNFADIVKNNNSENKTKENILQETISDEQIYIEEPVESKWSSYFSFNIIDLFSEIKYDFNILLNNCDINDFFDFVIQNSTIYNPNENLIENDSNSDNESEYMSD